MLSILQFEHILELLMLSGISSALFEQDLTIWAVQKYPQIHPHPDPEHGCLVWYLYTPLPPFLKGRILFSGGSSSPCSHQVTLLIISCHHTAWAKEQLS